MSSKPKKKRDKPYRPKRIALAGIRLEKVRQTLAPLDLFLSHLQATGEVDVTEKGEIAIYDRKKGEPYAALPAMKGLVDFYQLCAKDLGLALNTKPLEALIAALESNIYPVPNDTIDAAIDNQKELHRFQAKIPMDIYSKNLLTVEIKGYLHNM